MTVSGDWEPVNQLFHEALALAPDARAAFVKTKAQDAHVLQEVMSLLQTYSAAEGFLSRPPDSAQVRAVLARLQAGDGLGPFRITSLIGAGGMGEVYRAWDTRLDRQVAIKVLPQVSPIDDAGRERFEAEARAISRLTHPRISRLYDVGSAPVGGTSVQYLVMELVEGETLAARLKRGPLPVDQALAIAIEIAEALAAAHAAGVIHRDVKPANIMLTRSGAKLLDFGLARLRPSLGVGHAASGAGDPATHPTGLFGTLPYMAPELLRGAGADARTDLFAFGAVLYEMLAGSPAFAAGSEADLVPAILEREPTPISARQPQTPPPLERLIATCLARDPDERWQTAQDLVRALRWVRDDQSRPAGPARTRGRPGWVLTATVVVLASAAAVVAAAKILIQGRSVSTLPIAPKRFVVTLPDLRQFVGDGRTFSFVPDGSGIVYLAATAEDSSRIHLYTLSDGVSRALGGTEGAMHPTVSTDGKWVAFYRSNRLMKVAIAGGPPIEIAAVPYLFGVSWSADDWIVFASGSGLQRVPAGGGEAQTLTTLEAGEFRHTSPHVLPDGKAVLFTALSRSGTLEDAEICVVSISRRERRTLVKAAGDARYSSSGHLLYVRQADLLGVPFDPKRLQVSATPFLVAASIQVKPQELVGSFDLAEDGTLAWIASRESDLQRMLVWIDRKGMERPLPIPVRPYSHPALLPDERSAIVEIEATPHNLWHLDLTSGALTRLTHEGANHRPVVSRDGRFFVFSSDRTTPRSLFRQSTDGSGAPERLANAASGQNATSWSADGRWLVFTEATPTTRDDIWVLALDGGSTPRALLQTASSEHQPTFSPDGRWIAYSSDESGRQEVMIRSFPGDGPRKQVSTAGGETPSFSSDGKTLFYRLKDQLWAVPISTDPVLAIGPSSLAFELSGVRPFTGLPNYVVTRAGDRVLAAKILREATGAHEIQVMVNWREQLRHRVPMH